MMNLGVGVVIRQAASRIENGEGGVLSCEVVFVEKMREIRSKA